MHLRYWDTLLNTVKTSFVRLRHSSWGKAAGKDVLKTFKECQWYG